MIGTKRLVLVLLLAACGGMGAGAQVGVFGTVTGERVFNFHCGDLQNRCGSTDGTERPYGVNLGAYYDFKQIGKVRLGADIRGGVLNSNKSAEVYGSSTDLVRHYSLLGGVRGSMATPIKVLRPYAEIAVGYAKYSDVRYTQVQGFVGADLTLFPILDFRVIELGAGELLGTNSHGIQSIGVGIVFHRSR